MKKILLILLLAFASLAYGQTPTLTFRESNTNELDMTVYKSGLPVQPGSSLTLTAEVRASDQGRVELVIPMTAVDTSAGLIRGLMPYLKPNIYYLGLYFKYSSGVQFRVGVSRLNILPAGSLKSIADASGLNVQISEQKVVPNVYLDATPASSVAGFYANQAKAAADTVYTAVSSIQGFATSAQNSASSANTAAQNAQTYKNSAQISADSALARTTRSLSAKAAAQLSEQNALASKLSAQVSADSANVRAAKALTYRTGAQVSADSALARTNRALTFRNTAGVSADSATARAARAGTFATNAAFAKTGAEQARDAANASAVSAALSASALTAGFKGDWQTGVTYQVGNRVSRGVDSYERVNSAGTTDPLTDTVNWKKYATGAIVGDGAVTLPKLESTFAAQLTAPQWGDLNISGKNKTVDNFAVTTFYKWDNKSGAQAANFSVTKTAANNVTSVRITTTSSFTDAAPQSVFSGTRILPFTSADELKVSVISTLTAPCLFTFDLLDENQAVISVGQYQAVQLTNGNSFIYITQLANARYIRLTHFGVSFARQGGTDVATNFSGASETTFTFGIYDKGYSSLQTLKAKFTEVTTALATSQADVVNLKAGYGNSCKLQIDPGRYQFPSSTSVTSGTALNAVWDGTMTRFAKKSIRFEVLNTAAVDQDNYASRGVVTMNFPAFTVSKSISFWIKIPTDYIMTNPRAGAVQKRSFGQLTFRFYNGATLLSTKNLFPEYDQVAGWSLYKFLSDDLNGQTITSVSIQVYTYNRTPELVFWIDSFVADQYAQPVLTMTMDNDWDDRTVASGWTDYVKNNQIPVSLRVYLDATTSSTAGRQLGKRLYELGQLDQGTYSGNARIATTFASAVDLLKNDPTNGRLTVLNRGMASRDVIESHNAHNYLDDALMTQEIEAGYKMLRTASAYARSNYIDLRSPVIACRQFGLFSSLSQIDDTFIANAIQDGKNYIDQLIKYGSFGSILTHQVVTRTQADNSDLSLAGLYEVHVGIYNYALTKVASGELRLMTLTNLYRSSL